MGDDVLKPFSIDRAKQGRAKCKKCKNPCEKGELRIAKVMASGPFGDGPCNNWYHIDCLMAVSKNPRSTVALKSSSEIQGFDLLSKEDQKVVTDKCGITLDVCLPSTSTSKSSSSKISGDDNLFSQFVKLVTKIADEPSYNQKSAIIKQFLKNGSNKKGFNGKLDVWMTLLIPSIDSRVYNLKDKQIVKLFSRIFGLKHDDLLKDLNAGDVSETIAKFFPQSRLIKPVSESDITVMDVNELLDELCVSGQDEAQIKALESICKRCTIDDLKTIIRLIIQDLKMNCRERHVLDALHEDAYSAFQKSRDMKIILKQFGGGESKASSSSSKVSGLNIMTAISPMLAEACKDFDKALKKCPRGFYSEIKYDGERVQIHKQGDDFKFFSRNLKPVQDHKIAKIKTFLPQAFPTGNDLILDSEIIMVDDTNGSILPFGTLGKHKKEENQNAVACLFIFDCLYFNGEDLTSKTIKERKKFLETTLKPIKHHIELSEHRLLTKKNQLVEMTKEVLRKGLEGLVLKDIDGIYEPGKRRWLKVKKDYLLKGEIADSADLVILGCYFGKGKKMGNCYSIYLVGCYDESSKVWKTVTKVHGGLTDAEAEQMHKRLVPLVTEWSVNKKLPSWVKIDRSLMPNVLAKDPFEMPVVEVMAAEFTDSNVHTANSISMRFPRIVKIRDDKSPKDATTLMELKHLYEESKSGVHIDELNKLKNDSLSQKDDLKNDESLKASMKSVKRKKSDSDKSSMNDDDDDDGEVGESSTKKMRKKDENDKQEMLFKDFVLFRSSHLTKEEIEIFTNMGGRMTEKSKKANLVLYEETDVSSSLDALRQNYTASCKHYQKLWLNECQTKKSLVNPIKYFVTLRQL